MSRYKHAAHATGTTSGTRLAACISTRIQLVHNTFIRLIFAADDHPRSRFVHRQTIPQAPPQMTVPATPHSTMIADCSCFGTSSWRPATTKLVSVCRDLCQPEPQTLEGHTRSPPCKEIGWCSLPPRPCSTSPPLPKPRVRLRASAHLPLHTLHTLHTHLP